MGTNGEDLDWGGSGASCGPGGDWRRPSFGIRRPVCGTEPKLLAGQQLARTSATLEDKLASQFWDNSVYGRVPCFTRSNSLTCVFAQLGSDLTQARKVAARGLPCARA